MSEEEPTPALYSQRMPDAVFNRAQREQKARKILAVLGDHFENRLSPLRVLDLGCASGLITNFMAPSFQWIVGTDVDTEAIAFARKHCGLNAAFLPSDALHIPFRANTFDTVICAHVYEHVSHAGRMLQEIRRVLKHGGVCVFAAGNRLRWMEPHYRLPLLSVMPKPMANAVLKWSGRGVPYEETHLSYWGLKRLVRPFRLIDYTGKIIDDPDKFAATDVCQSGTLKQAVGRIAYRRAIWLMPSYIFLLQKV